MNSTEIIGKNLLTAFQNNSADGDAAPSRISGICSNNNNHHIGCIVDDRFPRIRHIDVLAQLRVDGCYHLGLFAS